MAAVGGYVNGSSAGIAGRPTVHKRGEIKGWTAATVRRHQRWLWSIRSEELTAGGLYGVAFTLTVRDLPESAEAWKRLRDDWIRTLKYRGLVRLHWVTEWQRRGVPHMHVAAYFESEMVEFGIARRPTPVVMLAISSWTSLAARYGANVRAQDYAPIDAVKGWLEYLSKHAARGVKHYQRQGIPEGWEKSGRLWGYSGEWPRSEPTTWDISTRAFWRYRRLVRSWTLANARASGDARRIAYARRMLKCNDRRRSSVRGVSGWIPEAVTHELIALLEWEGFAIQQRTPETAAGPLRPVEAA